MTHTDLPDPVVPAISRCGMPVRSAAIAFPETSCPRAKRSGRFSRRWKASLSMISRNATSEMSSLGTSIPTKPFPGTGAWTRMRVAAKARARSSARAVILLTRTRVRRSRFSMKSGSTPNWVIVGPRLISTTVAGAPKEFKVSSMICARWRSISSSICRSSPSSRISAGEGSTQVRCSGSSSQGGISSFWAVEGVTVIGCKPGFLESNPMSIWV